MQKVVSRGNRHCSKCSRQLISGETIFAERGRVGRGSSGRNWECHGKVFCLKCSSGTRVDVSKTYLGVHCSRCMKPLEKGVVCYRARGGKCYCQDCYEAVYIDVSDDVEEVELVESFS